MIVFKISNLFIDFLDTSQQISQAPDIHSFFLLYFHFHDINIYTRKKFVVDNNTVISNNGVTSCNLQ